jgi:hypothetical protein
MLPAKNILFLDSSHSDEERRQNLYKGFIYLYSQRASVMKLVNLARQMLEDGFKGRNPEFAQFEMDVHEYEALLNKLKPQFVNSPEGKVIMKEILADMGCDVDKTYFDLPRLRTSTANNYLTTGIAYAFDAHRDTWFSGPLNQLNWWFPIYDVQPDNAMVFYPDYYSRHVENGSKGYNCHEWNRESKRIAAGEIKEDKRKRPMPFEEIDTRNQMVIIPPVGSLIVFSGTHLHASIPNSSDRTRVSIDFRTVHLDDSRFHIGSPNIDNYCTGTIMRDFIHPTTYELLPSDIIMSYENGTPVIGK